MSEETQDNPYWREPGEQTLPFRSDTVVDAAFRIDCDHLPADHAYLLLKSVESFLPWFSGEHLTGIHAIHGAESGNGWQRPGSADVIHLSRRVRLILRIPRDRIGPCGNLNGKTLKIADARVKLGSIKVRELTPTATLFARRIITDSDENEESFLRRVNEVLRNLKVTAPKQLPGRFNRIKTPQGDLYTRSLMLADLQADDSIRIQESGVGEARQLGCGLFIPHKSIAAVRHSTDE